MRIRIKELNPELLLQIVVAFKSNNGFLVDKKIHESLKATATISAERSMSFTTKYDETTSIKTVVEFEDFCDNFYRIRSVTVNGRVIYGYSKWVDNGEQIVIDAE